MSLTIHVSESWELHLSLKCFNSKISKPKKNRRQNTCILGLGLIVGIGEKNPRGEASDNSSLPAIRRKMKQQRRNPCEEASWRSKPKLEENEREGEWKVVALWVCVIEEDEEKRESEIWKDMWNEKFCGEEREIQ